VEVLSKYTTEVRFICERFAGLDESQGFSKVDDIVEKARHSIFEKYPIFDENYRSVLENKILKHFYTREIGFETVGLWLLKLNQKMSEIMPYYNQFYESQKLSFNPLVNVDTSQTTAKDDRTKSTVQSAHTSTNERVNKVSKDSNETGTLTSKTAEDNKQIYGSKMATTGSDDISESDTPQGTLTNVENNTYLSKFTRNKKNLTDAKSGTDETASNGSVDTSNANNINSTENANEKNNSSQAMNENSEKNTLENYIANNVGLSGISGSELLEKYRSTFMNIDMLVIEELNDLFIKLW
jgi:hypothetical protein